MSKAHPRVPGPFHYRKGLIFGPVFSSVEKATIILGFIEFYIPEAEVTTEIQTERAIGGSGYSHSRRETELFPRMIFYNRVGKCGSRSVLRFEGFQFYWSELFRISGPNYLWSGPLVRNSRPSVFLQQRTHSS